MNKTYKYTLTAHEKKEISFDTGVARLAIVNGNGVDGSTIVVMREITKQRSGDLVSFIDGADAPFADFIVNIEAVQSGSGDPSTTNVRPITGFSMVNITRTGKNLLDPSTVVQTYDVPVAVGETDRRQAIKISLPRGTYTVHSVDSTVQRYTYVNIVSSNETFKQHFALSTNTSVWNTVTFTVDNGDFVYIYKASTTGTFAVDLTKLQIERGTTATDFEPYNANIYTITMPDAAGTVYGGTLDIKTGVLTVTHANIASYDGETINEPWISSMDVYSAGATPTTGAQVVYPLTTPVTYQLTPAEIRSLLGTNNVWADCGPVNVRYFVQSTQPMIDYIDDKTPVFFDAAEDLATYDVSLVGATSTDIKNYLLANKNANIVIRVKRYSTILLYYLREYSPNYFAEFATHAVIFDAEGTKSMRIDYLRLDLTQETSDFTDDYIILPTT